MPATLKAFFIGRLQFIQNEMKLASYWFMSIRNLSMKRSIIELMQSWTILYETIPFITYIILNWYSNAADIPA